MKPLKGFENFALESFLKFAADPTLTQEAFNVQPGLVNHPRRAEMTQGSRQGALASPEFNALFERKYMPAFPTIEELQSCPAGSLGEALAKHLTDNQIAIDFGGLDTSTFYNQDVGFMNYLAIRATRMHDVFHTVLGLGTTPMDEYALFNVQLAQFPSPLHALLMASGYLHTVFLDPTNLTKLLEKNYHFFALGKRIRFLPGFPFEDHWHTNLNEVRARLGFKPQDLQL